MVTAEEYKQAKIDFVSNLSGSGKTDLLIVFAVAGVCISIFLCIYFFYIFYLLYIPI